MLSNPKQDEIEIEEFHIERQKVGFRRDITQIRDTISFELRRHINRFLVILLVYIGFFILGVLIFESAEALGLPIAADSAEYVKGYLELNFGFLIVISGAAFGGSIIAEDYHKQTNNLLFPKSRKANILIGRLIARYLLMAACLLFFYLLVAGITLINYEEIPLTIFNSFGWALYFSFAILSFITMLSSFMKNTSMTIIMGIMITIIVFEMIPMLVSMSGVFEKNEFPLFFVLTYYGRIVSESLAMPNPRYSVEIIQMMDSEPVETMTWLTPSEIGAFFGILIYISFLLLIAYLRYKKRQSKGE